MAFRRTSVVLWLFLLLPTCEGQCGTGHREIFVEEGEQLTLTCKYPYNKTVAVEWRRCYRERFSTLGSCDFESNSSCSVNTSDYDLTTNASSTQLVMKGNLTAIAGMVQCGWFGVVGNEPHATTEFWNIRVKYPRDKVKNCSVHWDTDQRGIHRWTVSGSCHLDRISTDHRQYTCRWELLGSAEKTWKNITKANESGGGLQCRFHGISLNSVIEAGDFFLSVQPDNEAWMPAAEVKLVAPGNPELFNCSRKVTEGSNLTCYCQPSSTRPGVPRALVTWTAGVYPHNPLRLSNVTSDENGRNFACYGYWGNWSSPASYITYTVDVTSDQRSQITNEDVDDEHADDENDESPSVAVLAGAVGAAAVLLDMVIVVVVVIVMKRRKAGSDVVGNP